VLERCHQDPYARVVAADPSWVQLVMVDGDLAYGRADWLGDLVDPADRDRLEPVRAWGTPTLLDTSYRARPTSPQPPPTLAERRRLIAHYPRSDRSSPDNARPVRPRQPVRRPAADKNA
jgi:5-methylthioadenosine/S-adenosylhomocysteine deaminase